MSSSERSARQELGKDLMAAQAFAQGVARTEKTAAGGKRIILSENNYVFGSSKNSKK